MFNAAVSLEFRAIDLLAFVRWVQIASESHPGGMWLSLKARL